MCIVFFIFGHPKYKLILASNRDESLKRPTKPASYWNINENIISAIDLAPVIHNNKVHKDINNVKLKRYSRRSSIINYEDRLLNDILSHNNKINQPDNNVSGYGSWLGCTRQGLFATLTNYRENSEDMISNAISRGYLVRDFLLLKSAYNKNKRKNSNDNNNNMIIFEDDSMIPKDNTKYPISPKIEESEGDHIKIHHPTKQVPEEIQKKYKQEEQEEKTQNANITIHPEDKQNNTKSFEKKMNEETIDFPYEYINYIKGKKDLYNGFNLIVGDVSLPEPSVWYMGNKGGAEIEKLNKNTVYGLSNGTLNTYWEKIERGKSLFAKAVENHSSLNDLVHKLLDVLSDKKDFSIEKLPKTAFSEKLEKCCAPICIERERFDGTIFENDFATRTHTVIIIDNNDNVTFVEQDQYDSLSNNCSMKKHYYISPSMINNTTNSTDSNSTNINGLENMHIDTSIISNSDGMKKIQTPFQPTMSSIQNEENKSSTNPINIPRSQSSPFDFSFRQQQQRHYSTLQSYPYSPELTYYLNNTNSILNDNTLKSILNTPISKISTTPMSLISTSDNNDNNQLFRSYSYSYDNPYSLNYQNIDNDINIGNKNIDFDEDHFSNQKDNDNKDELKDDNHFTSISSCTPISPPAINLFETFKINEQPIKEEEENRHYIKRNVHDLTKANIHQFTLEI